MGSTRHPIQSKVIYFQIFIVRLQQSYWLPYKLKIYTKYAEYKNNATYYVHIKLQVMLVSFPNRPGMAGG